MTARNTSELLYDSEAALRLVDSAIAEMRDGANARTAPNGAHPLEENADPALAAQRGTLGGVELSDVLVYGYAEIVSVLGSLRESRSVLERSVATANDVDATTSQQLGYVSSVLTEIEARLAELATVFDPRALEKE